MASKTATVQVDQNGRCTIPVEVRRALEIEPEDYVEIEVIVDE